MAVFVASAKQFQYLHQVKYFWRVCARYSTGPVRSTSGKKIEAKSKSPKKNSSSPSLPSKRPTPSAPGSSEPPIVKEETAAPSAFVTQTPPRASDGKSYVVPEYYAHDKWSYVDYELEMKKMRLPQPSSKSPLQPKK